MKMGQHEEYNQMVAKHEQDTVYLKLLSENLTDNNQEISVQKKILRNLTWASDFWKRQIRDVAKKMVVPPIEIFMAEWDLIESREAGYIYFKFYVKPSVEVRDVLKQQGFRWSNNNGVWQRPICGHALCCARFIMNEIDRLT